MPADLACISLRRGQPRWSEPCERLEELTLNILRLAVKLQTPACRCSLDHRSGRHIRSDQFRLLLNFEVWHRRFLDAARGGAP